MAKYEYVIPVKVNPATATRCNSSRKYCKFLCTITSRCYLYSAILAQSKEEYWSYVRLPRCINESIKAVNS